MSERIPGGPRVRVAAIAAVAAKVWHLDPYERSRSLQHVRARAAIYLVGHEHGHTFCEMGRRFCRDHTTVMHALRKVPTYLKEPDFAFRLFMLRATKLEPGLAPLPKITYRDKVPPDRLAEYDALRHNGMPRDRYSSEEALQLILASAKPTRSATEA